MVADLRQYYGVRLADVYAGLEDPLEVAELVVHAPRGARVHQVEGGANAITSETEGAWLVEWAVAQSIYQAGGNKGAAPKMRDYPEGLRAIQARQDKKLSKLERAEARRRMRNE